MFTGREALFSIEQAISRVRADEGRLDAALRSAMKKPHGCGGKRPTVFACWRVCASMR